MCANLVGEFLAAVVHLIAVEGSAYLEIAESLTLCRAEKVEGHVGDVIVAGEFSAGVYYMAELFEEPAVDFGKLMYGLHVVAVAQGGSNGEYAHIGRLLKCLLDIVFANLLVLHKAVHSASGHSQTFLNCLLECAADCHHLAHRFHRRADLAAHTVELTHVPTGNLADDIVEGRLEEG